MPAQNLSHLQEAASSIGLAFGGLVRRPAIKLNLLPQEMRFRQNPVGLYPFIYPGCDRPDPSRGPDTQGHGAGTLSPAQAAA